MEINAYGAHQEANKSNSTVNKLNHRKDWNCFTGEV